MKTKEESGVSETMCFSPGIKFDVFTPHNYNHDTVIDNTVLKLKESNIHCNENLSSKNFAKATNKLIPGKIYKARTFQVPPKATGEDCINFLKKQEGIILTGGQGLSLLLDIAKEQLPKNKCIISFDEKDALFEDCDGDHLIPFVEIDSSDCISFFCLGFFEKEFCDNYHLLCFEEA